MSYNFSATMYQPKPDFMDEERKKKENCRIIRKIERILKYAERNYNCEFSERFKKDIKDGVYTNNMIPDEEIIETLVREWKIWEPYVSQNSFSRFIEDGLKSIITIQATATFRSEDLNGYIGKKAKVIKELPTNLATCVLWTGVLRVNGKLVR